jgi:small subunit ribosomal protein S9
VPDQPNQTPESTTAPAAVTPPETPAPATILAESAAPTEVTAAAPSAVRGPKGGNWVWGTGRRKTSVARVRIKPGSGKFLVKKREVNDYFMSEQTRLDVYSPLKATNTIGKYDIFVNIRGGGQMGQAGAIALGVARALMKADPALEATLRDGKYLTRDSRKVERKKPGRPGARKRFQFSKR